MTASSHGQCCAAWPTRPGQQAEDTFTYGVMHERQACQAAEIERTLPQVAIRAKK